MDKLDGLIKNYSKLRESKNSILAAYERIRDSYENGGKLLLCGNGGSAADCEHIAGELLKEFQLKRPLPEEFKKMLRASGADEVLIKNIVGALPAISLTSHISYLTAYCNDNEAEYMFAQQLYALGKKGDVLLAISTSGNSANIISAAIVAKAKEIPVVALTGKSGGLLREYADVLINVPEEETARIQELHLPIYHVLCGLLEEYFFGDR